MTVNEFMLSLIGLASGLVFYPLVLPLTGNVVELALRPFGNTKLPFFSVVLAVAAFTFLLFSFLGLAAVAVKVIGKATDETWTEIFQVWGRAWFVGFALYAVIPACEKAIRRKPKK